MLQCSMILTTVEGVTKKPNIEKAKPIVRWGRKATGPEKG